MYWLISALSPPSSLHEKTNWITSSVSARNSLPMTIKLSGGTQKPEVRLWPHMPWIHPRRVNWVILLASSSAEASPGGSLAGSSVQKHPQSGDPPSRSLPPGLCPEPPAPALRPWGQLARKAAGSGHGLLGTLGPLRNPLVFHKPSFKEVGRSEARVGSHLIGNCCRFRIGELVS